MPKDAIILFRTDWSNRSNESGYFTEFEAIPTKLGKWIVQQKPKMIGLDVSGPDHEPFPIHKLLLSNDILIIENLTNLDLLPETDFEVFALPLKLNLDGSPARVIARI